MTQVASLLNQSAAQSHTSQNEKLYDLASQIQKDGTFGAVVLNDDSEIVGVITEHDIVRETVRNNGNMEGITVGDAMTKKAVKCDKSLPLEKALNLMGEHHIRHLIVTDKGAFAGIVSIKDILQKIHRDEQLEINVLRDMAGVHQTINA